MSATHSDLHRTFSGSIPEHYDRYLGPAWFARFAEELAKRVPPDPGGDVLELACGTGLMTRPLRKRLHPARKLVATDLNQPMLDYAAAKMSDLRGIEWRQADASKLPFEDRTFGAVACSFGVMFVPDREALFAEARRVLLPGGVFVFNVWDRIEENPCPRICAEVIEGMLPGDGEIRFRLPYEMHDRELLGGLLQNAGFRLRKMETVRLPVEGVTAREVAMGQVRGTPRGLLLAKRGIELDDAIEQVTQALQAAGGKGASFRLHGQAIAVEAAA